MRLPFSTLFAFSAGLFSLFPVSVSAVHPQVLSRHGHQRSPASDVLTSRQHRVPRDLLDVCINANVNLLANITQALGGLLGPLGLGGKIQLCLCLKDLNVYLQTNNQIQLLVDIFGLDDVSAAITGIINESPNAKQCTFPDHAHHTCNNSDPCHYECDPGYTKNSNGQCVCAPPNISCNNVCGSFPHGCGSAVPRSSKVRRDKIQTLAQAQAICKTHESVCGIPGREGSLDFECTDTTKSSGSCGGCIVPHSFMEAEAVMLTSGSDCDAIPNVQRATCSSGRCIVHSCTKGWKPNANNDGCVSERAFPARMVKLPKRSDPISANASATTTVGGGLITQLVAIVDMVLGLPLAPSSPSSTPITTSGPSGYASAIGPLLNDVRNATDALLQSPTVSDLLFNLDVLLDTLALLNSATQQCQCEDSLGLEGLTQQLVELLTTTTQLQKWCARNTSTSPSSKALPASPSHDATTTVQDADTSSIVVGLSDLINGLGLLGPSKAGASVSGLGGGVNDPVNGLLTGLGIGPSNFKRRDTIPDSHITANATVNLALLVQLRVVVDLATDLLGLLSSLPPADSSSSSPVLGSVLNANLNKTITELLQAASIPALLTTTQDVISAATELRDSILGCSCLGRELLDEVTAYIARLLAAVTGVQDLCAPSSTTPSPTSSSTHVPPSLTTQVAPLTTPSSGIPVIVSLDRLLSGLGLGDVKVDAAILGLGDGLSSTTDDVLNAVDIGPDGLQSRQIIANTSVDIDSSLLNALNARGLIDSLLDLVLGLNATHDSLPATSSSALDPNLIGNIVNATMLLPLGSTYAEVVALTADVVAESIILLKALEGHRNLDDLGLGALYAYTVKVLDAALALQEWCHAPPAPNSPPPSSTPTSPSLPTTPHPSAPLSSTTYPVEPPTNTGTPAAPSSSAADDPIVIGLTKTLHDLGLDIDTDVVVDGLGNNIDDLVNSITDSLGIGPNGARRRFARD